LVLAIMMLGVGLANRQVLLGSQQYVLPHCGSGALMRLFMPVLETEEKQLLEAWVQCLEWQRYGR